MGDCPFSVNSTPATLCETTMQQATSPPANEELRTDVAINLPGPSAVLPIEAGEFARLMERWAPFEAPPRLAVGLSGGADSMALTLLVRDWVRRLGGSVSAWVVDHGLRAESAAEAADVVAFCASAGIEAEVLPWRGPKPSSGVEQAARCARHNLLARACLDKGLLHLLLAHHADDQAETVAMRGAMRSGSLGLSGMSACIEQVGFRVLRPLLAVRKARLVATLRTRRVAWFDDPMNHDLSFTRVILRREGTPAPDPGFGNDRQRMERRLAACLPSLVEIDSAGRARLDRAALVEQDPAMIRLTVARVAQTVGGLDYPPRGRRLDALVASLAQPGPVRRTLGRCTWCGGDTVQVRRERRNLPRIDVLGGRETLWDGRFRLTLPVGNWSIGTLSATQWRDLASRSDDLGLKGSKIEEFGGIPAVSDLEGLAAIPHLGYARESGLGTFRVRFAPKQPLVPALYAGAGMMDAERR